MKAYWDIKVQSGKGASPAVPVLSSDSEEQDKQQKARIKKLESQIRAQQKKNQEFRETANAAFRTIQETVQEHKERALIELKSLEKGVLSFCEDKNSADEQCHLLLDIVLDSYESLGVEPVLPEWCLYQPPRPWGEPKPKKTKVEEDDDAFFSSFQNEQKSSAGFGKQANQFVESQRKKAERERKLWHGENTKGPLEERSPRELRASYIRLARAIHPDRVRDQKEQEIATAFMKRVNAAYSNGDAKALFDLEKELARKNFGQLKTVGSGTLSKAKVSLLSEQLETLKKELRKLKKSSFGEAITAYTQALKQGYETIEFAAPQLPTMRRELKELSRRLSEIGSNKGNKKAFFSWLKRHYSISTDPRDFY